MATVTVGDMLDRAQSFENMLEAYYADLRDRTTRDGVRMLTYYLARHRRHLPEALDSLSESQVKRLRKVQLKYDSDFVADKCFGGERLPDDVSADKLLDAAIELVETLIGFYSWLTEQPLGDEAVGVCQSLLRVEQTSVVELKKIKAMNYF